MNLCDFGDFDECDIRDPLPVLQLETDEKKLRKEITFTIKNQLGVRVGLFTPDMAFESIVKEQIEKLLQPSIKCVDLVSSELGAVIQKCADGVCVEKGGRERERESLEFVACG